MIERQAGTLIMLKITKQRKREREHVPNMDSQNVKNLIESDIIKMRSE